VDMSAYRPVMIFVDLPGPTSCGRPCSSAFQAGNGEHDDTLLGP
jgi:hypothetical protein